MTGATAAAKRPSLTRRTVIDRVLLYGAATLLALWTLVPIYLIALAAFGKSLAVYEFPKSFLPTDISTETMSFFVNSTGVLDSDWTGWFDAISRETFFLPPSGGPIAIPPGGTTSSPSQEASSAFRHSGVDG